MKRWSLRSVVFSFIAVLATPYVALGDDVSEATPAFVPEKPIATATLHGTWRAVSMKIDGATPPDEIFRRVTVAFAEGTFIMQSPRVKNSGSFRHSATESNAQLDLVVKDGPSKGQTFLAIYKLSGDRLTVCLNFGASKRPTKFDAPPGSQCMLIEYEREKPPIGE